MQRQDEFLRYLQRLAHGHREANIQDRGLAMVIDKIEARLPLLKPVAYENYDLGAGLSGNGVHHICGDRASIQCVQQALHDQSNIDAFWRPAHVRLTREVEELHIKIKTVKEALS